MKQSFFLVIIAILMIGCSDDSTNVNQNADDDFIWFSGRKWEKISKNAGPGPNRFLKENAFVAGSGDNEKLHLKMKQDLDGVWSCAELRSVDVVGYGEYTFQIEAPNLDGILNGLDGNLVVGFFTWDNDSFQEMGNTENDIEFAKWGSKGDLNTLQYTVQPSNEGKYQERQYRPIFPMMLLGGGSTHKFLWTPTGVKFTSYRGYGPMFSDIDKVGEWEFNEAVARSISQDGRQKPAEDKSGDSSNKIVLLSPTPNTRIHINLWLFKGQPPQTNQPFELVLKNVDYKPLADLSNGLVAYYPFDGNAKDMSGNGNDGTIKNVTFSYDRRNKANSSAEFDGVNSIIDCGNSSTLLPTSFSISAWIYPTEYTDNFSRVVQKATTDLKSGYGLEFDAGYFPDRVQDDKRVYGVIFNVKDTDPTRLIPVTIPCKEEAPLNQWHHVVYIYDDTKQQITLYYDDVYCGDKNVSVNRTGAINAPFLIGGFTEHTYDGQVLRHYFKGKIDDIRVYSRCLSTQEIQSLYEN